MEPMNAPPAPPRRGAAQFPSWEGSGVGCLPPGSWAGNSPPRAAKDQKSGWMNGSAFQFFEQPGRGLDQHFPAATLNAGIDHFITAFDECFLRRDVTNVIVAQFDHQRVSERR